ncbi:MAG: F0F1 ATP synthase subunit epsilon [Lachnospiraceae bacterium]|nr:F0F1 ATP synthase subunit epsilon [Lachnospiraceae bacterium]
MAKPFRLKILAADGPFYEGEAISLTIPAKDGRLQILADHEPMVIATVEGLVKTVVVDDDGEEKVINGVAGIGFVHISHAETILLVDTIEYPEDIDRARAQRALERAKEKLRQDQSIQEYRLSEASLARAMVRLSNANKTQTLDQ